MALMVLLCASEPLALQDLSIHVAMGRWMLSEMRLHEVESFTWTQAGTPFIHGTWLFSLLAAAAHRGVGYEGIRLLNGAAVGLACLLAWRTAAAGLPARFGRRGETAAAVAAVVVALFLFRNTAPRGQTLAFCLFALSCWLLETGIPIRRAVVYGLLLGWVWGGIHGSFPAGVGACLLVALGDTVDGARGPDRNDPRAALALAGALAAGALAGPYGPALLSYVVQNSTRPAARGLTEWGHVTPLSLSGLRILAAAGLWLFLLRRRTGRPPARDMALTAAFGLLAVWGHRFGAWFGLAAAAPLARAWMAATPHGSIGPAWRFSRPATASFVGGWLFLLAAGIPANAGFRPGTPVDLLDALEAEAHRGRVFAPMSWGGLLADRLARPPDRDGARPLTPWPYFLDVRVWIFDDDTWATFLRLARAEEGWNEELENHHVTHLLLSPRLLGCDLLHAARRHPDWVTVLSTPSGSLLRRRGPAEPAERFP